MSHSKNLNDEMNNRKILSQSILYPADQNSLIVSVFIRSLMIAERKYNSPRKYFETLGIEMPGSLEFWEDFDITELTKVTGAVISTENQFFFYEDMMKPVIRYEETQ
jgi:5-formaminoimidazole-4-carboxamide-1-beta-D-ribofuranosyl 5'-monophosphate synthetase|tara:strand:- start:1024 stop:1344 length:321 start_codon:yes stop_codon:yes gene_type:complete